jgi:hypothetical protein
VAVLVESTPHSLLIPWSQGIVVRSLGQVRNL